MDKKVERREMEEMIGELGRKEEMGKCKENQVNNQQIEEYI